MLLYTKITRAGCTDKNKFRVLFKYSVHEPRPQSDTSSYIPLISSHLHPTNTAPAYSAAAVENDKDDAGLCGKVTNQHLGKAIRRLLVTFRYNTVAEGSNSKWLAGLAHKSSVSAVQSQA